MDTAVSLKSTPFIHCKNLTRRARKKESTEKEKGGASERQRSIHRRREAPGEACSPRRSTARSCFCLLLVMDEAAPPVVAPSIEDETPPPIAGASSSIFAPGATVSDVDSLSLRMLQRSLASEADSKVRTCLFLAGRWPSGGPSDDMVDVLALFWRCFVVGTTAVYV